MRFFTSLFFLLFCLYGSAHSANPFAAKDSLLRVLQQSKHDTSKGKAELKIAFLYQNILPDSALIHINKAIFHLNRAAHEQGLGWAYTHKSAALFAMGKDQEAIEAATVAVKKLKNKNDYKYAYALKFLGKIYAEHQENDKAVPALIEALQIIESKQYDILIPDCAKTLGTIFFQSKNYTKALEYFTIAEKASLKNNNEQDIALSYLDLAALHVEQRNFNTAKIYFDKCLLYSKKLNYAILLSEVYFNIGKMYEKMGKHEKSVQYADTALIYSKETNSNYGIFAAYVSRATSFVKLKKFTLAELDAKAAGTLLGELNHLPFSISWLELKKNLFEQEKKYDSAFYYQKKWILFTDSLKKMESEKLLAETEARYQNVKKEAEIQKKNSNLILQQEKLEAEKKIRLIIIGVLCLLFTSIYLFYNRYKNKQKLKLEYRLLETEHKALQLQMNPHFIFNVMHAVNNSIKENHLKAAHEQIILFSDLMRCVLNSSREKTILLSEEIKGLHAYLSLSSSLINHKFNFTIYTGKLDTENILIPPMMIQPLVENAIQHGIEPKEGKGNISIVFSSENKQIKVVIEDNGVGRQHKVNPEKKSVSLDITQERLKALNGSITIEDLQTEGKAMGTNVCILFPLSYAWE